MNTFTDRPSTEIPSVQNRFLGASPRDAWLSTVVVCLMGVTMLALFYFPVRRSFINVEVNYNEGWNAYKAAAVASGIPLYGTPPPAFGTGTGYPPLSFHLIAFLGNPTNFVAVGRWVSLISVLATGLFVSLIVKGAGGSRTAAVFSFLLYEIGIALLKADRIGMSDPQLLGEALSAAGLYFYVRHPDSKRFMFASALLFCLAGFTKHNLLAFPAAVALDLLFRSLKSFFAWAGAMLLCAGLLAAATFLFDGRYFLVHLLGGSGGRSYSFMIAWSQFYHYVEKFQALVVIGTAWSIRAFRSRRLLVSAFVISHLFAFWLAGGYGVNLNIFFNAFAATAIVCGLALSDAASALLASRPSALNPAATTMFGLCAIGIMIFVPGQLRRDRQQMRILPVRQSELKSAVEFLKSRPGPAVCESLLLCYEAGKPFEYEPFSVKNYVKTGALREDETLNLLRTHHFQTVQVEVHTDEEDLRESDLLASLASDQKDPDRERRFTPNFMRELLADYQLSKRTTQMAIFTSK
jgi:hypothetical protein